MKRDERHFTESTFGFLNKSVSADPKNLKEILPNTRRVGFKWVKYWYDE